MKKNGIKLLTKTELKEMKKQVVGLRYNMITTGLHKGLYEVTYIVNLEGVKMNIWTKEQQAYLDGKFNPIETRLTSVETRLTSLEESMVEVKTDIKKILGILENK